MGQFRQSDVPLSQNRRVSLNSTAKLARGEMRDLSLLRQLKESSGTMRPTRHIAADNVSDFEKAHDIIEYAFERNAGLLNSASNLIGKGIRVVGNSGTVKAVGDQLGTQIGKLKNSAIVKGMRSDLGKVKTTLGNTKLGQRLHNSSNVQKMRSGFGEIRQGFSNFGKGIMSTDETARNAANALGKSNLSSGIKNIGGGFKQIVKNHPIGIPNIPQGSDTQN